MSKPPRLRVILCVFFASAIGAYVISRYGWIAFTLLAVWSVLVDIVRMEVK
jgi:hypothetical protein